MGKLVLVSLLWLFINALKTTSMSLEMFSYIFRQVLVLGFLQFLHLTSGGLGWVLCDGLQQSIVTGFLSPFSSLEGSLIHSAIK